MTMTMATTVMAMSDSTSAAGAAGWIQLTLLGALAATLVACASGAGGAGSVSPPAGFAPRQVSHVYTQSLAATPDEILPLLTPLGEKAWAHGWDPVILFQAPSPGTGTVFAIRRSGHPDTIWLLEKFDAAARHVRYLHVTPGSNVTEIDIRLAAAADDPGQTAAAIRYTYTGFSERGNALVDSKTAVEYRRFMQEWEAELNGYLAARADRPTAPQ